MKNTIIDASTWLERLQNLPRIGATSVTAFYEHRIGAICKDVRYLLVPLDDHLVHRGDGIFESLTLVDGKILELDPHMQRLEKSAEALKITSPMPYDEIRQVLIDVATAGGERNGYLKVLMGRGEGGMGISPDECPVASFYCIAGKTNPLPASFWENGLKACRSNLPAKHAFMAQIKSTNYLPNVLMTVEAKEKGVDVSLSFDLDGHLAEAAIANIVIINDEGSFISPPFHHALPGTTALLAINIARSFLPVEIRNITEKEVFDAIEVLVLGTGPECVAITQYENKCIGTGVPSTVAKLLKHKLHDALIEGGTVFLP